VLAALRAFEGFWALLQSSIVGYGGLLGLPNLAAAYRGAKGEFLAGWGAAADPRSTCGARCAGRDIDPRKS
jgi:hypothetical protein